MYKEFSYDQTNVSHRDKELLWDAVQRQIEKLPQVKKICELGCGNGTFAARLADKGYDVTAVDFSESGIRYAVEHYGEKVKFHHGKIDQDLHSRISSESFDLVFSVEVIEHLYCPSDLLKSAHQLLHAGGWILLTTPYHGYLKNLAITLLNGWDRHWGPLSDCGHIKFFSIKTLRQLIAQCGFSEAQFCFWGRLPGLWKSMIAVARKPAG